MTTTARQYTTRAPFQIKGSWRWMTWTHNVACGDSAIIDKARELNADAWDIGMADHASVDRYQAGCGMGVFNI